MSHTYKIALIITTEVRADSFEDAIEQVEDALTNQDKMDVEVTSVNFEKLLDTDDDTLED